MTTKAPVPLWSKKVQKKLIDKQMTKKELAKILGVNYCFLVNVMSGYAYNEAVRQKVCEYFGIER